MILMSPVALERSCQAWCEEIRPVGEGIAEQLFTLTSGRLTLEALDRARAILREACAEEADPHLVALGFIIRIQRSALSAFNARIEQLQQQAPALGHG